MIFKVALLEKLLNVSPLEIPRLIFSWALKFLMFSGHIIGFTVITAIFVHRFSITYLPLLFLIQAVLTAGGMFLFSLFQERFQAKSLVIACAFLASCSIFLATLFLSHNLLFFAFIFLALGIFLPQLSIFLSNFIESLFSPLEGERVFPLIDSAHTLGGIFAGLIVVSLAPFIASYKFLYVWILFLFLMMCVAVFLEPSLQIQEKHETNSNDLKDLSIFQKLKHIPRSFKHIQEIPFLQNLVLVLFIQGVLVQFLEFQFTKTIASHAAHGASADHFENSLTHGLGSFHILFHTFALVIQLFLASRFLKRLGIAGSFLMHAFMTFFGAIFMLMGLGPSSVILVKSNFEVSGIIQENAYEASYYALKEETRRIAREFLEGFLSPLGVIMGTLSLFLIQKMWSEEHALKFTQLLYFFLSFGLVILSFKLQQSFSSLARQRLLEAEDRLSKFHAIEILSQKGHSQNFKILSKTLQSNQAPEFKVKILKALGSSGETSYIPEILSALKSNDHEVLLAALYALEHFPRLTKHMAVQNFTRKLLLTAVEKIFRENEMEIVQQSAARVLVKIDSHHAVLFFEKHLQRAADSKVQKLCLYGLSFIQDVGIIHILQPYLEVSDPFLKAQALRGLWPYAHYQNVIQQHLETMLDSQNFSDIKAALQVIGDLKIKQFKKAILSLVSKKQEELRFLASACLLKLDHFEAVPVFTAFFLSSSVAIYTHWNDFFINFKPSLQNLIAHHLKKNILKKSFMEEQAMNNFMQISLENMSHAALARLEKLYIHIESYAEADYIQNIRKKFLLKQKMGSLSPDITF